MDNFIAHILVVDDDDGIRSLVKKYLNENNYLVTTANSAEDATKKDNEKDRNMDQYYKNIENRNKYLYWINFNEKYPTKMCSSSFARPKQWRC